MADMLIVVAVIAFALIFLAQLMAQYEKPADEKKPAEL